MNIFNKKGQNMAEYSILIALVVAAAIGIKTYVQRGVQARIRDESDQLGQAISNAKGWSDISSAKATLSPQFEPGEFSKQATTETVEDTTDYTLEKLGTTSEEITKKTKQAAGDYEKHDYTKE